MLYLFWGISSISIFVRAWTCDVMKKHLCGPCLKEYILYWQFVCVLDLNRSYQLSRKPVKLKRVKGVCNKALIVGLYRPQSGTNCGRKERSSNSKNEIKSLHSHLEDNCDGAAGMCGDGLRQNRPFAHKLIYPNWWSYMVDVAS